METLTKHFREITRAAFQRHGFAQAEIVTAWNEIVGEELACHCAPERIKWPRGAGDATPKSGGTLVVRAAPGRSLDLQYDAARIISRINSFFGYGAVAKLKIVTATEVAAKVPAKSLDKREKPYQHQMLEEISDGPLKAALQRLGQNRADPSGSSPQRK